MLHLFLECIDQALGPVIYVFCALVHYCHFICNTRLSYVLSATTKFQDVKRGQTEVRLVFRNVYSVYVFLFKSLLKVFCIIYNSGSETLLSDFFCFPMLVMSFKYNSLHRFIQVTVLLPWQPKKRFHKLISPALYTLNIS